MRQSTRISFAQERAAAARGDELVGIVAAQHQQAEGAAYVVQGAPHGREQVARLAVAAVVVEESDELREGLGVGVAGRIDALLGEEAADRPVVLDDAVVHHDDGAARIEVGMGVALRGGAVRVWPLTSKKLIDRDSGLFQNGSPTGSNDCGSDRSARASMSFFATSRAISTVSATVRPWATKPGQSSVVAR